MQSKNSFVLLVVAVCLCCQLSAQNMKGTWQFEVGGGLNITRYAANSYSASLVVEVVKKAKHKLSTGFQGYSLGSYQLTKHVQICTGLGIGTYKTYTTINTVSSFFLTGATTTDEVVEQRFTLLELPIGIRVYLWDKDDVDRGYNPFLEVAGVMCMPIVNDSKYQKWENGNPIESRKIDLKPLTGLSAVGLTIGDHYALSFGLFKIQSDVPEDTTAWRLAFAYVFNKHKTTD